VDTSLIHEIEEFVPDSAKGFDDAWYNLLTFTRWVPAMFIIFASTTSEARLGGGTLPVSIGQWVPSRHVNKIFCAVVTVRNDVHNGFSAVRGFNWVGIVSITVLNTSRGRAEFRNRHLNPWCGCHVFDNID